MERYITIICFIILVIAMFLVVTRKHDYNCDDFDSKESVMKVFSKSKKDIYHLDGDGDGIPCESLIN